MAARTSDVDVVLNHSHESVPNCPHGPTLLFEKFGGQKNGERFFACSAFRDRKECNFFRWENDKTLERASDSISGTKSSYSKTTHKEFRRRFKKFKKLPLKERMLCQSCGLFLLPEEHGKHEGHKLVTKISKSMLMTPSKLFIPQENNKTYAQYLFSDATVDFIISTLEKNLNVSHVLCVGAPRIHEAIMNLKDIDGSMQSLLLDLDSRYMQLYSVKKFCHYNMFNHYFFEGDESRAVFEDFLKGNIGKKVAIVMDPPFGGMVETLSATVQMYSNKWKQKLHENLGDELAVLWFFPYFFEPRIQKCLPSFHMLDYKVDYDNHTLFRGDKKKLGSPVRIFTNVPAQMIPLPEQEGYWFCQVCRRYSAKENVHCDVCDSCTSKDGRTYRHCFECDKCVKPSKLHCKTCKSCQLPDHQCGIQGAGCHICGEMGHKRKECPNKGRVHHRKRKMSLKRAKSGKKKKLK